jgi:Aspartyl/Asparaginyl beta-hydroxylase
LNNFREILSGIDVCPLLDQLQGHPDLWNTDDSWTRHKPLSAVIQGIDDIVLRFNKSPDWNKPAFKTLNAAQLIIFDVMRAIPAEHLGKVIITRLPPGKSIEPHIDHMPPGIAPYYQRYQIPLSVNLGVVFKCGDEELYMKPGSCYWFNNQITHSVVNNSDQDRISMLTDIRPFVL